jgi:MFS family permease
MKPIADMHEALTYARKDHALGALMFSKATFGIGAGLVGILAILVTNGFDGGDAATGLLIGARGLGAALGPLIAARLIGPSVSRLLRLCGVAGLIFGGAYLVVSVAPTLAVAALFVFVAHLGGGSQWTLSTFGLQLRAPDAVRGRILAGDLAFATLVLSVSTAASGAMSQQLGPRPAIAAFSVLALVAGSAYLLVTRRLRGRLAREEAATPAVDVRAAT